MSAYLCYICDQLKDSDEAYLIEADGEDALVCQQCVSAEQAVKTCGICDQVTLEAEYYECCEVDICKGCAEDHADVHTDRHLLRGVSRKDFA